jgi:hypothetical protein
MNSDIHARAVEQSLKYPRNPLSGHLGPSAPSRSTLPSDHAADYLFVFHAHQRAKSPRISFPSAVQRRFQDASHRFICCQCHRRWIPIRDARRHPRPFSKHPHRRYPAAVGPGGYVSDGEGDGNRKGLRKRCADASRAPLHLYLCLRRHTRRAVPSAAPTRTFLSGMNPTASFRPAGHRSTRLPRGPH